MIKTTKRNPYLETTSTDAASIASIKQAGRSKSKSHSKHEKAASMTNDSFEQIGGSDTFVCYAKTASHLLRKRFLFIKN